MSPERLRQLDRLFQLSIDIPPERRRAFLDEACADDCDMRGEVESLIAAHEQSGDFMEGSAADIAMAVLGGESLAGEEIAQYRVGNRVGIGGMCEVYAATDRMGRKVALKVLAPSLVRDRQDVSRFLQEARAVLALNHPNVVTVYDIGEADGIYYIASELVEGDTLRTVLLRGRLSPALSVDIAIQICAALAAAHDKGVVHRDIKPENVMLRDDGYVKVLDFGIAKLTEQFIGAGGLDLAAAASPATVAGLIVGTIPYLSPEQARGAAVDARSDVWSTGVVLYELLTGQVPFKGSSSADVLARILEREPAPVGSLVEDAPEQLQRIITRSLTKDPDERYASMTEMLADLKALRQDIEIGHKLRRLDASVEASGPTGLRSSRRKVVASVAVVTLFAAVFAFVSDRLFRRSDIESVAILPFVNATGDPELEYLSDGVTESLINALAKLPGLSVKARSVVFRYKGQEADPKEIASTLSVEAVVNGQLERRGDRLMLSLAIANGRDGDHLWGERYLIEMTDLVSIQSGMTRDIAEQLHRHLSGAEAQRVAQAYTSSSEAYQLYLRGRYHVHKVVLREVQTGIRYLEQATTIDPGYAVAYVGLADAYRTASTSDLTPSQIVPKAKAAAARAVEIDPDLASAHTHLGILAIWYDFDPAVAERHFENAFERDPNDAEAHLYFAHLRSSQGRHDEALREAERSLELDPFNLRFSALSGMFLIHAGQYDEAIARLQATIALDPNHILAQLFIAAAYIEKEMYPEAIAEARAVVERTGRRMSHPIGLLGVALAKSGRVAEARALLDELLAASRARYVSPYGIALIYNALGDRDEALAWLERGYESRDHKMNLVKVDPKWDNLDGDPRFEGLVRRVGF